jgi:hypothetical protein
VVDLVRRSKSFSTPLGLNVHRIDLKSVDSAMAIRGCEPRNKPALSTIATAFTSLQDVKQSLARMTMVHSVWSNEEIHFILGLWSHALCLTARTRNSPLTRRPSVIIDELADNNRITCPAFGYRQEPDPEWALPGIRIGLAITHKRSLSGSRFFDLCLSPEDEHTIFLPSYRQALSIHISPRASNHRSLMYNENYSRVPTRRPDGLRFIFRAIPDRSCKRLACSLPRSRPKDVASG